MSAFLKKIFTNKLLKIKYYLKICMSSIDYLIEHFFNSQTYYKILSSFCTILNFAVDFLFRSKESECREVLLV